MDIIGLSHNYSLKHTDEYQDLKSRLHRYLIQCIEDDQVSLKQWEPEVLSSYAHGRISRYISEHHLAVNRDDIEALVRELIDELTGYGPLQGLLADDKVDDILVNGAANIYIERGGRLQQTQLRFIDDNHVLRVIQKILAPLGRRLDETNPMVDARLPDGSRVNAIIPPLSLDGPCLSIRKFRKEPLRSSDLLAYRTLDEDILEFLCRAVEARCNILISGSTGSGKTTLLNILTRYIDENQRIVTIEDAAELQLDHSHVVRLETRPPNIEGEGEVTARDLVRNVLRMRPDRIVLGEIRGMEVLDMLQAMNTGHEGSMSTLHANSGRDALSRLGMLAGLAAFKGTEETLREMIASAVDLVVHVGRMPDGRRRITQIMELVGVQDGHYAIHELFAHDAHSDSFRRVGGKPQTAKLVSQPAHGGGEP
ncbi:MAG: ATPase [Gammaproteobacteria bacterium]|nr:ATPase [Gammaproteobacteria bacterium]